MRKGSIAALLIIAVMLMVAPLAAAGKGQGAAKGKGKFNLVGTVSAVGGDAGSLTVKVKSGTKTVREYRGEELTLTVADDAKIRLVTEEGCVAAELADIPVGAKVKVRGRIDRGGESSTFIADFVKAKPPAEPPTADEAPVPAK